MNNLQSTNKIKVGLKIAENLDFVYTASYTYLEKGQNTNLIITGATMISGKLQ
jgi:hypothetical protein